MKSLLTLLVVVLTFGTLRADISMPKKDTFYDKAGRGLANIVLAPAEIIDTPYSMLETEGSTVAATKGVVQGFGRMFSDMGLGIFDLVTAPIPLRPDESYSTFKMPPFDSMVVSEYPPGDLKNFY